MKESVSYRHDPDGNLQTFRKIYFLELRYTFK